MHVANKQQYNIFILWLKALNSALVSEKKKTSFWGMLTGYMPRISNKFQFFCIEFQRIFTKDPKIEELITVLIKTARLQCSCIKYAMKL